MECSLCNVILFGSLAWVFVQFIRFIFADADLQLLYKVRFGLKPETLLGKTVWITGASSGIGEFLAYDLAKAGCKLILSSRRKAELERVKKQCLTYGKIKEEDILVQELDLLDYENHGKVVQNVLASVPKIDILVNNAGRSQRSFIEATDFKVDKEVMELNLFGTVSFTKCVLPHFVQHKGGHIVVTSSIAGKLGAPNSASYSASKFAVQGWFETLRTEYLEHNVGVTLVCPGPVYSNITSEAFTGEAGKKHGVAMRSKENRMTTERCTELMVAAIANKLGEVWISNQPILFFAYICQYMPDVARWLAKKTGHKTIQKIRDSKI